MYPKYPTIIIFLLLFTSSLFINAHSYKVPMIVDTDMALDDVRALILLCNQDFTQVKLIVTSDGALSPALGLANLKILLKRLNRTDVPIAMGTELGKVEPEWRQWSKEMFKDPKFPAIKTSNSEPDAVSAIGRTLKDSPSPCLYLCLGPLSNLAGAIEKDPGLKKKISRVIYLGCRPSVDKPGWNTQRDIEAAKQVFFSGLKINCFVDAQKSAPIFDKNFLDKIVSQKTPAGLLIRDLHQQPPLNDLLNRGHFRVWDELTVLYLNDPGIFKFSKVESHVFCSCGFDEEKIKKLYLKMCGLPADSHIKEREIVLFDSFPMNPVLFKKDVAQAMSEIIRVHGKEEWKATVLSNELHRHLGIYSIVGAKMGVRARELLGAPLDSLTVVSLAGNNPPLSCLNDGLQVSTGASLGRGNIRVEGSAPQPTASFSYKGRTITLKLKEGIVNRVKADIKKAIAEHGELTPTYFIHVRSLAISYWLELSRKNIFHVSE